MSKLRKNAMVVSGVVCVIAFLVIQFVSMIPMTLRSPSFLLLLAALSGVFSLMYYLLSFKVCKPTLFFSGLVVVYLFVAGISSLPVFNASRYQKQLSVNEDANFSEDITSLTFEQIPVVDRDSAMRLGDRKMGEMRDYVSQFDVAEDYTQINYQNKPVRVTPLEYNDIIKWLNNFQEGLPGYVLVDMVSQEAEVVRLDQKMKYSKSDLFFRNIDRYLFIKYPTKMFAEVSFEIDEKGIPYYVAPSYEYKVGLLGGRDITGVVLVNACTGDHQYYAIDEVPTWLDRIYPEGLVFNQLNNWGKYVNGFWNTYFGQKGMLRPTDGYNYIAKDDDVYLYTGLTSVVADKSNVGFALINLRTKESNFYSIPGSDESSAQQSAEGQVQDLKYKSTFPILMNCAGEPTYFMALKDGAGLVKQYAFVSVRNFNIVATGGSVAEAQKNYLNALGNAGEEIHSDATSQTVVGAITDIQSAVVEGNSKYYFTVEGVEGLCIAPISVSDHLPLLDVGDGVEVTFIQNDDICMVSALSLKPIQ